MASNPKMSIGTLRVALRAMRPYRSYLVALVPVSATTGLFEAATLILVTHFAMSVAGAANEALSIGPFELPAASARAMFWWASAALAGATLFGLSTAVLASRFVARVLHDRRVNLLAAFLGASWLEQGRLREGELHELMSANCDRAAQAARALTILLVAGSNLTVTVLAAITIFPAGAVVIIGALFVLGVAMRPLVHRTYRQGSAQVDGARHLAEVVTETVRLRGDVKTYGVEQAVFSEMVSRLTRVTDAYRRSKFLQGAMPVLYRSGLIGLVLVGLGLTTVIYGGQSATRLGVLVVLLLRALSHGQSLQASLGLLSDQVPFVKRLEEVEASLTPTPKPLSDGRAEDERHETGGSMQLDKVGLSIDGNPIILDVSAELRRGELVAVVGPSGAGKSTLANVITGVMDPSEGRVLLGGADRKFLSEETWRSRIAYVAQHTQLIKGTIADNVRFYRSTVGDDAMRDALLRARLISDLSTSSEWTARDVSPGSNTLSGGQSQRVSIARAIAGGPDYLILDEPSAALDEHSEKLLAESLRQLRDRGLGVLVVAHRPALVAIADRVIRMDHGRVVATGPPERLVKSSWS